METERPARMRLIQLFVPTADRAAITEQLSEMGVSYVLTETDGERNGSLASIPNIEKLTGRYVEGSKGTRGASNLELPADELSGRTGTGADARSDAVCWRARPTDVTEPAGAVPAGCDRPAVA